MADRASGVVKRLESEVTCPLCLDIFTEPKRLPCDHVYCRECLRGLALRSTTGSISCPECRTDIPVPNFDVTVFTTPHQVNRLIEMYQNNLSLAETSTPQVATCGVHNSQPLDLYCETCETLVCRDCIILTCAKKNHVHGFVDEMVKKYQTDLQRQMEPVKHLRQQISTALDNIVAADRELERRKEEKLRDIQSTFDAFSEIIERERRYLTESVESSSQKQEDLNSAKRNEISEALKKLNDLIQYTEIASLQESKFDFLQGIGNRKQSIDIVHECSRSLTLQPATAPEVEVELLDPMDIKKLFGEKNLVYRKGDVVRGRIQTSLELTNIPALAISEIFLYLHPHGVWNPFSKTNVVAELCCCHRDSVQVAHVKKVATDKYSLSFSLETRGHHELHIKCNDTHICGSPIPVYITIHPDQIMAAGKPEVTPLHKVAGIKCHWKQLILSQIEKGILLLDSSSKSIVRTIPLPGVFEVLFDGTHIYATDSEQHRLVKMDMNGIIIKATGRKGNRPGEFNFPNGIRLSKDSEIFVCDSRNHRIQVFDTDLNLIRVIGRRGSGNGCFEHPDDLTFDERDNLYVADERNHRIQVLTPQGEHILNIGKCGKGLGEIEHPISVAIHKNLVYVTDCNNKRISVFKTTGEFVATFGEELLTDPECIAIDENGYIHVTDGRSRLITF